jgi:hypothetical protein
MHTTYGIYTCIETNEILAFGMEVYSRYIPDICKNLEYVRHIPDICLTYDTIRIPDAWHRRRRRAVSGGLPVSVMSARIETEAGEA